MAMACKLVASENSGPSCLLLHSSAHATHRSAAAFISYVSYRQLAHASFGTCNMWFCLCFLLVCYFVLPMGPTHTHTHTEHSHFVRVLSSVVYLYFLLRYVPVCALRSQVHKWMNGNKQKRNAFHDARYFGFFSFLVVFWSLYAAIIVIVIITDYNSRSMWIVGVSGLTNAR